MFGMDRGFGAQMGGGEYGQGRQPRIGSFGMGQQRGGNGMRFGGSFGGGQRQPQAPLAANGMRNQPTDVASELSALRSQMGGGERLHSTGWAGGAADRPTQGPNSGVQPQFGAAGFGMGQQRGSGMRFGGQFGGINPNAGSGMRFGGSFGAGPSGGMQFDMNRRANAMQPAPQMQDSPMPAQQAQPEREYYGRPEDRDMYFKNMGWA